MLALTALLVSVAPSVRADEASDARARELFDNGALLYEEGRYEDAVAAWQMAYELSPKPLLLFNIANAQERLGRYQEALDSLNRYRAFAPKDERKILDRRITNLEKRVEEQKAWETPAYDPTSGEVPELQTRKKDEDATPQLNPAPFLLMGGGAGLLGAGAALWGSSAAAGSEALALCGTSSAGTTHCLDAAGPFLEREQQHALAGDVLFIAGGGLAAAGAAVLVGLLATGGDAQADLWLSPSVTPQGAALGFGGRF